MPRADRPPVWLWINLLSLDAPLVALVWQDFLARTYGAPLLPQGRWALGLTVWAIYIADRLLDVRAPASGHEPPLSRFYRTNLWLAAAALALILSADLLITVEWLRPALRVTGFFVLVATLTYLATFTTSTGRSPIWKSTSAALLFAAGVFTVAWTRTPHPLRILFFPALAFAVLCGGNLAVIRFGYRNYAPRKLPLALALFALLCIVAGRAPWFYAIGLSSVSLTVLSLTFHSTSVTARRVLADVALLSPLFFR